MLSNIFVIVIVCIASLAVQTDSFATHSRTLHRLGKTALRAASGDDKDYELELRSPCKINLFLRIMGRRENGYHDLASLFQTISLSDEMYFSRLPESATKDEMVCTDSELSVDDSNLVIKALNLMRSKTGVNQYFSVKLNKIVPMQAGLGGGSANAATAMFAFNKLCGFPATLGDLKEWSGDIGSDITFFFSTGTAYCTGRGEIIDPLPPLPEGERTLVHIVKPMQGLSTGSVFNALNLAQCSKVSPESLLERFTEDGPLKASAQGCLINDLEDPAFECDKTLDTIKKFFVASAKESITGSMMSGSGTSLYALGNGVRDRDQEFFDEFDPSMVLMSVPGLRYYRASFLNKPDTVEDWYEVDKTRGIFG